MGVAKSESSSKSSENKRPWKRRLGLVLLGLTALLALIAMSIARYPQAHLNPPSADIALVLGARSHEGQMLPVDTLQPPYQNPIQYLIHCIKTGAPISGPLSPAICRIGQQIVDSAILSAREKRAVALVQHEHTAIRVALTPKEVR